MKLKRSPILFLSKMPADFDLNRPINHHESRTTKMTNALYSRRSMLRLMSAAAAAPLIPSGAARAAQQNQLDVSEWTSAQVSQAFKRFALERKMPEDLDLWLSDPSIQKIEPYRVFDNVWNVGIKWVSSYAVQTTDGWVLIDTLHEPFVDRLFENLQKARVPLDQIRLVLMTHGHFDHVGGYYRLRPLLKNARFVMSRRGWDEAADSSRRSRSSAKPWTMDEHVDVVGRDGDRFTIGGSVFTLLETPGHTWGTASYMYQVEHAGKCSTAVTIGGQGLNAIEGVEQIDAYIASMKRLADPALGIEVDMTAHPFSTGLSEKIPLIEGLGADDPHPLVDRAAYLARLEGLTAGAESLKRSMQAKS